MITPNGEVKGEALSIVNSTNTAVAAQSGSLQVFGTPFMIALMEKATCAAVSDFLEDGETTVGTNIDISHLKASGAGAVITATAILDDIDGRKLTFSVTAKEADGTVIGKGTIERFVVLADKFMKKVESK
ncbi:MAG: thioesterase family protein [Eubacterium sp.]